MADLERDTGSWRMFAGLLAASHVLPLEELPEVVEERAAGVGLRSVRIYVSDLQEYVLRRLVGPSEPGTGPEAGTGHSREAEEISIAGTLAGRAYQRGRVHRAAPGAPGDHQWWIPLLNGTERIGLLRLTSTDDDERALQEMKLLASLVALILSSKRDSSDTYARLVRTRGMNVAAEMQWNLMPPRTYTDGRVVVGATMEPAYEVSGDAFDYAIAGDRVHLSIFDGMGHDTAAGLTANLAVAACRNLRRQGAALPDMGEAIERIMIDQFGQSRYATGILADLDTRTGVLSWVNRGHHPPVVIRGGRWATLLRCPPAHPLGTDLGLATTMCQEHLQPGDRVVFYTDGITESGGRGDREFGLSRFIDFLVRHHADGRPVPETLRRLMHAVMEHHGGRIQDDATVLLCEWIGHGTGITDTVAVEVGLDAPGATGSGTGHGRPGADGTTPPVA